MKGTLHFLLQTKNTIIKPNLLPRIDNILRVVVRGVVEVVVLEQTSCLGRIEETRTSSMPTIRKES